MGGIGAAIAAFIATIKNWASLATEKGKDAGLWLWFNGGIFLWRYLETGLSNLASHLVPLERTIVKVVKDVGLILWNDLRPVFVDLAHTTIKTQTDTIVAMGKSTPDNALDAATLAYVTAFGAGLANEGVAALFETILPEKLQSLNVLGEMLEEMSGMKEVAGKILDPLMEHAFGKSLDYHFRSVFKAELPSDAQAVNWHARRFLDDKQLRTLFKYSGLKDEYEDAYIKSAYTPISARALSPLADDTDFDMDKFRELLRFGGHREQDIELMVKAFLARALKSARSKAETAAVDVFEAGLMDQPELDSAIDDIYSATDKRALVNLAALWKRLKKTTEDFADGWLEECLAEYISVGQYRANLAALGYIDPMLSALVGKAQAKLTARGFLKEVAAADKLKHERQHVAVTDAMLAYKNRQITDVTLTAMLLATGLDPVLVALYVTLAKERGQKKLPKPKPPPKP